MSNAAKASMQQSAFSFCDDPLPEGMRYQRELITVAEERELLQFLAYCRFRKPATRNGRPSGGW